MTISRVGSATGTNTCTLPAHQVGDLILCFAYRDGSTNAPTPPEGQGWNFEEWGYGTDSNSYMAAWKIAASTSEAVGTWTNATSLIAVVYRGVDQANPIGGFQSNGGAGTTVNFPAFSLEITDGSSWVVGFAGHRSINTDVQNAPTNMTNITSVLDGTDEASAHDTNAGVTSWTSQNVSVGGTSSGWITLVAELRAGDEPEGTEILVPAAGITIAALAPQIETSPPINMPAIMAYLRRMRGQ